MLPTKATKFTDIELPSKDAALIDRELPRVAKPIVETDFPTREARNAENAPPILMKLCIEIELASEEDSRIER